MVRKPLIWGGDQQQRAAADWHDGQTAFSGRAAAWFSIKASAQESRRSEAARSMSAADSSAQ
jgi:hypothetical protein